MRELSLKYGAKLLKDEGKGRCYARNLGIKEAEGSIVIFLDDDVALEKDWLELVVKNFNLNPRLGGAGGNPITVKDGKVSSHLIIYEIIYDLMINKAAGLAGWQAWQGKSRYFVRLKYGFSP